MAQSGSRAKLKNWQEQGLFITTLLAREGVMVSGLLFASATQLSLLLGSGFSLSGLLLLFWVEGYGMRAIVGPYRFVRHPKRLALWLLGFGFAIASRSFPAVLLSFITLPCLFFLEAALDDEEPDLKTYKYRYHVPALLPTLVPFRKDTRVNLPYSWRRVLSFFRRSYAHSFFVVAYGWISLLLVTLLILPPWAPYLCIAIWLTGLSIRMGLKRRRSSLSPLRA